MDLDNNFVYKSGKKNLDFHLFLPKFEFKSKLSIITI